METTEKLPLGTLVKHRFEGVGRIVGYDPNFYLIYFKKGVTKVPYSFKDMQVELNDDREHHQLKSAMKEVLGDYGWIENDLELAKRWNDGKVVFQPGDNTQPKEVPLDTFFKKIIGIREKLRVLEQKINNHPNLTSVEKIDLEGYITRCYGSLTTFNILFADKASNFKGSSSD